MPDGLENIVVALLIERGMTLATAESCTGGLLAKLLTDVPGASSVYPGGVVAYCAQSKASLLSVDPGLIIEKGAVSREVAIAMADGARNSLGADIGLAITGIAGPGSDDSGTAPGTVFIALSSNEHSYCVKLSLIGDRNSVRTASASYALDMVRNMIVEFE